MIFNKSSGIRLFFTDFKPSIWVKLISLLLVIEGIIISLFFLYAWNKSKIIYDINDSNFNFLKSNIDFKFNAVKTWEENGKGRLKTGGQYECLLVNNEETTIKGWSCLLTLPEDSYTDSWWSGIFHMFNASLLIIPVDYNTEIHSGESVTFGFILHSKEVVKDPYFELIFQREVKPTDYFVFNFIFVLTIITFVIWFSFIVSDLRFLRMRIMLDQTFNTIVNIVDSFDEYTYNHSRNVAFYSRELARRMKLSSIDVINIFYVALVHDIGKISIMREMLNKRGVFTNEERELIKNHTLAGAETLKDFTAIPQIKEGALYHHERFDGKGYPKGLSGKSIPLFARIICIADSFDVMTSRRCYKDKFPVYDVIEELKNCSGSQFDPQIVPYMIEMINDGIAPLK